MPTYRRLTGARGDGKFSQVSHLLTFGRGVTVGSGGVNRMLDVTRLSLAVLVVLSIVWFESAVGQDLRPEHPSTRAGAGEALIQPGDQVSLRIFREPELSGDYRVSELGELVLPRLGRMQVSQMSVSALQVSLLAAYSEFLRNPSIEVTVLRRIGIQGEVRRPDIYLLDLTVTLRDAIAHAGGVTEAGNPRNIVIVRGDQQIQVGGGEDSRFLAADLRSGDLIYVGRRSWIALNPAVAVSTATGLISFVIGIVLLVR